MTAAAPAVTFATRPMRETDRPFLFNSFLLSYGGSDEAEGIPSVVFNDHYKIEFGIVLQRFTVLIAHPEGEEDEIAGWLVFSGPVVGWLYVKKTWRRLGVARLLLQTADLRGPRISALYSSFWARDLARSKGLSVRPLSHGKAVRMLVGA